MKTYAAVFVSVFLAELGDKTQHATLVFAASPDVARLGVFAASAGALVLSSAIAVGVGSTLGDWLPHQHLRTGAAVGFIAIGVWMLWSR
jgi:putative Ca2+/H+ antiporter (TMEM165/GDT1 family)